jgi:23S rRNA (uridine2552-2'-O)-methyltransferase
MANSRRDTADSYTQRAHKEGYPARSVYKLEEIQKNFSIIRQNDTVLDVGAAPGSWTLYTHRELLKGKGTIISVDLNPLSLNPVPPTVTSYVGDAFSPAIRQKLVSHGPFDAIISDAAPMTTGNRSVDTSRSEWLAENVVRLAAEHLKPHGNLVIKIYQGGGEAEILKQMRTLFAKAKPFKPKACRSDSFEIFLIGLDRLPPAKPAPEPESES